MPRNGSGQFVLPPSNPVVPDTLIATSWANPTLSDIAAALSTSIATDGQTPPTANLPMAGFRHTNVGAALAANQYARADQVQGWALNIVSNVSADVTGTVYSGQVPFGIGNAVAVPSLMPVLFVPSINNGGPSTLALNGGTAYPILNENLTTLSSGQIKAGRPYALVFLAGNWILVTNTLDIDTLNTQYVRLNGGTMTGPLILSQDPTDPLGAASKQWVTAQIVGGTAGVASFNARTGAVVLLSSDVTTALGFSPANIAGATFTGPVAAPSLTATGKVTAPVFQNTAQVNAAATGAIGIDASLTQNHVWNLTGNITITVTNAIAGQIIRILLTSTTGRTVTWPTTTFWPLAAATAPIIDAGTVKVCLVVLEYTGSNWLGNASIY